MSIARAATPSRSQSPQGGRPAIDAATVMRIKNLQLRARVVVEGFFHGLHRSPMHGFSAEFSEYRQYTPGDDTKYVDWRLYARSDRFYIKRFEDETNRRCYLVVDLSRSMGFGSLGYSKADYARTLAATFAYYLTLQHDCVGLMVFDEVVRDFLPARYRPGHLRTLISMLDGAPQGSSTNPVFALEQIASLVKKRGLVIILSDFLTPVAELRTPLSYLRSRGHEVVAMRVLDPAETQFSFDDATLLRDLESGRPLYVDPQTARNQYMTRFARHEDELRDICVGLGVAWTRFVTDQSLDTALFEWLASQVRQPGIGTSFRRNPLGSAPRGSSGVQP
jgi:uncharacterized protein (DUF58 family)